MSANSCQMHFIVSGCMECAQQVRLALIKVLLVSTLSLVSGTSKILKIGPYILKGATGIFVCDIFVRKDPDVPKCEIKMGEIEENWQTAKFYCSEIKLIYSTNPANPDRKNLSSTWTAALYF